jgi:hypothetical protein
MAALKIEEERVTERNTDPNIHRILSYCHFWGKGSVSLGLKNFSTQKTLVSKL